MNLFQEMLPNSRVPKVALRRISENYELYKTRCEFDGCLAQAITQREVPGKMLDDRQL